MSRARVGYEFRPVPEDIAPEWVRLPYQTRMLGVSLWLLGRGEPIPVPRDDWAVYLLGKLEVSGPDRPNLARALKRLHELGLLVVCDGSATCLLRVCQLSATRLHTVCDVSAERKAAKSLKSRSTERGEEIEEREREARARESSARFERPPVGEAPPNTPPSEQKPVSSEARCWQLYQQELGTEHLMLPMNHHEALRALASAARAESDGVAQGESFDRAVQRLLGAWLADAYWKKNPDRPRDLRNLKTQLEAGKYTRPKSVAKVLPFEQLSAVEIQRRAIREAEEQREQDDRRAAAARGAS